jgi:hypothetical protein
MLQQWELMVVGFHGILGGAPSFFSFFFDLFTEVDVPLALLFMIN